MCSRIPDKSVGSELMISRGEAAEGEAATVPRLMRERCESIGLKEDEEVRRGVAVIPVLLEGSFFCLERAVT